jgi:hypothetical protein
MEQVFQDEFMLQNIMQYLAAHQFLYIAVVDRNFYQAYTTVHSSRTTKYNVTTLEHAKVCYKMLKHHQREQLMLISVAAGLGKLEIVQWLWENGCRWNVRTYYEAKKGNHLHIVKWCNDNSGAGWWKGNYL